jgi:signal transduction histidine kinase
MMSGIFLVVFATILGAAYSALTRSARQSAETSLSRATQQLARLAERAIPLNIARHRAVANDSSVRVALRAAADSSRARSGTAQDSAIVRLLEKLRPANDSLGLSVELWSANGKRVAFAGPDRFKPTGDGERRVVAGMPAFDGLDAVAPVDSLQYGKIFPADGHMKLWIVLPIMDKKAVLGYVARENGFAANPATEKTIRELVGHTVYSYYRNSDGTGWTTLSGGIAAPPVVDSGFPPKITRAGIGEILSTDEEINGTPLVISMEAPMSEVLSEPRRILRMLAFLSVVLIAVGVLGSWLIARRVTEPLRNITAAASTIARGDYATRVPRAGDAELVRLADSFNDMVQEIAESHDALAKQTDLAKSANRAKSDFLATMSHELRTPLNAIGGYVDLMDMGLRGEVNEAQRRDLTRIRAAQQHVLGLISSMLDLSRIEAGRVSYDMQPVALDAFLEGLEVLVAPQAATKSIVLDYVTPDPMLGALADREKLRQILLNLLSNAIRHTPSGGRITLSASASDEEHVAIRVGDTGPGIPEAKHEAIFEPFVQLDRTLAHPREGVGLGLSISRDLARGMGGELNVSNQPTGGACFTLTLQHAVVSDTAARMAFTGEMPVGQRSEIRDQRSEIRGQRSEIGGQGKRELPV